ncbi:hypothetical protein SIM91_42890 [Rhodococcus opacus]|uniref:hypothetical protein n=1 Tax=Rhodococcus opacus TaxID=37919 RepID=UPI000A996853|nr:hypothetical protein [Rhodococcus opacus]MDX5969924.1 hypothetical protein [Rhodococcus opacus]NKY76645.1 hypothetical protein [Rhodococcus opacus]CAG7631751.1 hypothetical protein E143388_07329 [Rhodococcus opacus]
MSTRTIGAVIVCASLIMHPRATPRAMARRFLTDIAVARANARRVSMVATPWDERNDLRQQS